MSLTAAQEQCKCNHTVNLVRFKLFGVIRVCACNCEPQRGRMNMLFHGFNSTPALGYLKPKFNKKVCTIDVH